MVEHREDGDRRRLIVGGRVMIAFGRLFRIGRTSTRFALHPRDTMSINLLICVRNRNNTSIFKKFRVLTNFQEILGYSTSHESTS